MDHVMCIDGSYSSSIKGHQYLAGTSFLAPQSITENPREVYYLDE